MSWRQAVEGRHGCPHIGGVPFQTTSTTFFPFSLLQAWPHDSRHILIVCLWASVLLERKLLDEAIYIRAWHTWVHKKYLTNELHGTGIAAGDRTITKTKPSTFGTQFLVDVLKWDAFWLSCIENIHK